MSVAAERIELLMKRCQRGVGGLGALNEAHDIMAECYGVLGALMIERQALEVATAKPGTVAVSIEPLTRVLSALIGAPHLIRELQYARTPAELFPDNPINVLIREVNAAIEAQSAKEGEQ